MSTTAPAPTTSEAEPALLDSHFYIDRYAEPADILRHLLDRSTTFAIEEIPQMEALYLHLTSNSDGSYPHDTHMLLILAPYHIYVARVAQIVEQAKKNGTHTYEAAETIRQSVFPSLRHLSGWTRAHNIH